MWNEKFFLKKIFFRCFFLIFVPFFPPDQAASSGKPSVHQYPIPDQHTELRGIVHPQGERLCQLQLKAEFICSDSITPVWWPYVTHLLSSQRVQSTSVPSSHLSDKPARWDTLLLSGMVMPFCTESVSRQQFCRGLFIIWNINSSGEGELCISCKLKSCKRVSLQSPMPSSQQHPVISGHRHRRG